MTFIEGPVPSIFSSCTLSPWEMVVVVMVVVALVPMVACMGAWVVDQMTVESR